MSASKCRIQMGSRLGSLHSQDGASVITFLLEFWEVSWAGSSGKGKTAEAGLALTQALMLPGGTEKGESWPRAFPKG